MKQDHDHLLAICLPVNTTSMPISPRDQRRHHGLCCVACQLVFCHRIPGVNATSHDDHIRGNLDCAVEIPIPGAERPWLSSRAVHGDPLCTVGVNSPIRRMTSSLAGLLCQCALLEVALRAATDLGCNQLAKKNSREQKL